MLTPPPIIVRLGMCPSTAVCTAGVRATRPASRTRTSGFSVPVARGQTWSLEMQLRSAASYSRLLMATAMTVAHALRKTVGISTRRATASGWAAKRTWVRMGSDCRTATSDTYSGFNVGGIAYSTASAKLVEYRYVRGPGGHLSSGEFTGAGSPAFR